MLIFSTQVNAAVFAVFLTLELTEIFLFIGNFAGNANIVKVGGYIGIVTALCAWYTSAAGVINGMKGSHRAARRQAADGHGPYGLSDHRSPASPGTPGTVLVTSEPGVPRDAGLGVPQAG